MPDPNAENARARRAATTDFRRLFALSALTILGSARSTSCLADNPAEAMELPKVEVVGTSPLPGLATPLRDVPANVQIYTARDIGQQRPTNLGEYLEQTPNSVAINSAQGNPFQADVNFRGFTASPVLGTPQGMSVFQDGVRINESFGDGINWDFLPATAISSMQLIPGANPAFGLNTLGGALAVHTKSGSHYPGAAVEAYGGSFGRRGASFEYGGSNEQLDYFVTGNAMNDRGWAEHNPSAIRQLFGKLGWQTDQSDLDVSVTLADNTLQGTQTLPLSFWDDIRQPYTWPDRNHNQLVFLAAKGSRFLSEQLLLGGNAYFRQYRNDNFSSNVNDGYGDIDPDTGLADTVEAHNDRSGIDQQSVGFGLQATYLAKLGSMENQFSLGASGDFGVTGFTQESQTAAFTADRGAIGLSAFERETDARMRNAYYGLFFVDTLKLDARWSLTAAGRYNLARVKIEDRSGLDPALNGSHRFSRFNPSLGLNFNPNDGLTAYASYNTGARAPTPIELTCADPAAPCKLPNNFIADPPLKMVLSRTVESGLRGKLGDALGWNAALYRTDLDDDIQFISAGSAATNAGYFQNVGKSRRQGLELGLTGKWQSLSATLNFSQVDATFQSSFAMHAPANSSADADGNIQIRPGDRIPGIPKRSLKLRLEYAVGERAFLGLGIVSNSGVFARGDENNRDRNGQVPGYTVVNLDGRYALTQDSDLILRVANLFDRRYANFGVVGENYFNGPNRSFDPASATNEQFRGPGAPRGIWLGLRYKWS